MIRLIRTMEMMMMMMMGRLGIVMGMGVNRIEGEVRGVRWMMRRWRWRKKFRALKGLGFLWFLWYHLLFLLGVCRGLIGLIALHASFLIEAYHIRHSEEVKIGNRKKVKAECH